MNRADLVPLRHYVVDAKTTAGVMLGCAVCSTSVTAGTLDFALELMAGHWTKMLDAFHPAHSEIQ